VNGKWLRAIRLKADISMTRMAADAGVSVQYINNIEQNRRLCPGRVERVYRNADAPSE
jgi:transcriptional regulator with XRE-family HTH domain